MSRAPNLKAVEGDVAEREGDRIGFPIVPATGSGSSPAARGGACPGLDPGGTAQMSKPSGLTGGAVEGTATRLVPLPTRQAGMFGPVVAASLFAHAVLIAAGFNANLFGEARSDGGAEEAIVIEGVSVEMLDSVPQALSTAEEITEADSAAAITEATIEPVADDSAIEPDTASVAELAADPIAMPTPADVATLEDTPEPAGAIAESNPLRPLIPAQAGTQTFDTPAAWPDVASQTEAPPVKAPESISLAPALDTPIIPEVAELALSPDGVETPTPTANATEALHPTVTVLDETALIKPPPSTEAAIETATNVPRPLEVVALAEVPDARSPARTRSIKPDAALEKPAKKPAAARAKAKPVKAASLGPTSDTTPSPASVAEPLAKGPTKGKAGAGGSDSSQKGKAATASYQAKLVAHLRRFRNYPDEARRRKITGTAVVSFTIDAGGRVVSAKLAGATGRSILDNEALAMVRRASPFPAIPPDTGQSRFTVRAPIRFDMK